MAKSMTGYGAGAAAGGGAEIRVEMKSVNSRYFDFSLKIPRAYMSLEDGVKRRVQSRVSRGKADVFVTVDPAKAPGAVPAVNIDAARAYMAAISELKRELEKSGSGNFSADIAAADLLRLPEVLTPSRESENSEETAAAIFDALELALASLESMRAREGERLRRDVELKLRDIERLVERAELRAPEAVSAYEARLRAKLEEVLADRRTDEARILTEVAIFADKTAADEETVRLRSHLEETRAMLGSDEPIGRKLDFLIQEMNREANTIGAKCGGGEMTRVVVELKAELEKLREQAQNIE
ncbi:MAG: YicC family protein [Oscillospiraceae bacterium]|jgi:uncharacterized protein (TIGR00255 family)|nr:YicC family protein [Oscillospiraceae bacterium]